MFKFSNLNLLYLNIQVNIQAYWQCISFLATAYNTELFNEVLPLGIEISITNFLINIQLWRDRAFSQTCWAPVVLDVSQKYG